MKLLAILVLSCGTLAANGQVTNAESLFESTGGKRGTQTTTVTATEKRTEINKGNVTYSGVVVQALRVNPIQLVNPAAPANYGSAQDNMLRDPFTGRASGLSIFSIRF
ncbi:MAG: hypothetical protein WCL11_29135 [Verrucomicrobiota bacterium]